MEPRATVPEAGEEKAISTSRTDEIADACASEERLSAAKYAEPDSSPDQGQPQKPAAGCPSLGGHPAQQDEHAISSKLRATLWTAKYHLPSLAITIFLTVIYAQEWLWPGFAAPIPSRRTQPDGGTFIRQFASTLDGKPSANQLAALQFAAKLNEGLIILSISNILFHRLRYLMLRSDGVPLGLLAAPFQLNSPMYLLGPEFFAVARTAITKRSTLLSVAFVIVATIVALAAGPFSAILMIPRPGLWAVNQSHPFLRRMLEATNASPGTDRFLRDELDIDVSTVEFGYLRRKVYLTSDLMYPQSIGPELGVSWSCPNPGNGTTCRSLFQRNFGSIWPYAGEALGSNAMTEFDMEEERQAPGRGISKLDVLDDLDSAITRLWTVVSPFFDIPHLETVLGAVSPSRTEVDFFREVRQLSETYVDYAVARMYTNLSWADEHGRRIPTKLPEVWSQDCTAYTSDDINVTSGSLLAANTSGCFRDGLYPGFDFKLNPSLAARLATLNWESGFLEFVDIQDVVPHPLSAAAVLVPPPKSKTTSSRRGRPFHVYIFAAQWAEAADSFLGGNDNRPGMYLAAKPGKLRDPLLSALNRTQPPVNGLVHIDSSWVNSLDLPLSELSLWNERDPYSGAKVTSFFELLAHIPSPHTKPMALTAMLTSVMSAAQCSYGACITSFDGSQAVYNYTYNLREKRQGSPDTPSFVHQQVRFYQEGYGYRFEEPIITAGFVVLYFHVLLVVIHVAALARGGFRAGDDLTRVGEHVVLALCSKPPPFLRSPGASVIDWRILRLLVSAREVAGEDGLEMTISEPRSSRSAARNDVEDTFAAERVQHDTRGP